MNCSILIFAIIFIIQIYIFRFSNRLINNKCKCGVLSSTNEENKYLFKFILFIKYYSILTMIVVFISFLNNAFSAILKTNLSKNLHYFKTLYLIYFIAGLIAIYLLFYITKKIKYNKDCKYNKMKDNEILYYYSIFIINIYVMIVLASIFSSLCRNN